MYFDVMGPLGPINNLECFKKQLITLHHNRIRAITTPIWWGLVEKKEGEFDWDYYKRYAQLVTEIGIKWIPIFATHKCGSSVGDNIHIPLPEWLFKKANAEEMLFKDENGNFCDEILSLWWPETTELFAKVYSSFCQHFKNYEAIIVQINLSCGPASELKYPSYNPDFGWRYPGRGKLQAYSKAAQKSFRDFLKKKYSSFKNINSAWGLKLKSFKDIHPPRDGDMFFINGVHSTYGKDFMEWYQFSLEQHFAKVVDAAKVFRPTFPSAEICQTLSGIHWLRHHPSMPRAAEYCAGYYDYERIVDLYKSLDVGLVFTCLEMDDHKRHEFPEYSAPKELAHNIAELAKKKDVRLHGENALPMSCNSHKYSNIKNILSHYNFTGFTFLRMNHLVDDFGNPTAEMDCFRNLMGQFQTKLDYSH